MYIIDEDTRRERRHKLPPDISVWIIWERDLRDVLECPHDPNSICREKQYRTWRRDHTYLSPLNLEPAIRLLNKISREERGCSIRKLSIPTNVGFPSTNHFLICDFRDYKGDPSVQETRT
jgi:hypothetical protein